MATKKLSTLLVLCFTLAITLALTAPQLHAQTYTTIDVPGAIETDANDINTKGTIVGFDCKTDLCANGALAQAWVQINGTFKFLKPPGSTQALAYGINDSNEVVGWYYDSASVVHGFSFSKGTYTKIDPPGSTFTNAWGVNSAGEVVGAYVGSDGLYHGFTLSGTTYTTFNAPNGATLTEFTGINNLGQMTGIYIDSSGVQHGFTLNAGKFSTVTFPGNGVAVTAADRINDTGEIVGLYGFSTTGPFSGYSRIRGTYTTIAFPSSTETRCRGLNNAGTIVGRYTDTAGAIHGMMFVP
jgi:uncharacterized membrane protein